MLNEAISIKTLLEGSPSFTLSCAGLLEHKWSALELLKSAFNAENFIRKLSVYLQAFRRNSLLKCALRPKIAKNSLKTPFWGFKVVQGYRD